MADVILTAAGQAIGSAFGGPIGAAIGGAIGGAIGQTFTPTQKFQGPRLGDLRVTGTEYGQTIPWVVGGPRISGQIIWASRKREIANTQKQGKGGGGGAESTTYTYEVDVAYLLSENPIAGVSRVWINGELVALVNGRVATGNWFIDGVLSLSGQLGNGKFTEFRVYTGTDDQMPDSIIEAVVGVGNTPAYRGRGYCVIKSLQLGTSGQLPNITFELQIPSGLKNTVTLLTSFADATATDTSLFQQGTATPVLYDPDAIPAAVTTGNARFDFRQGNAGLNWVSNTLYSLVPENGAYTVEAIIDVTRLINEFANSDVFSFDTGRSNTEVVVYRVNDGNQGVFINPRVPGSEFSGLGSVSFVQNVANRIHIAVVVRDDMDTPRGDFYVNGVKILDNRTLNALPSGEADNFKLGGPNNADVSKQVIIDVKALRVSNEQVYTEAFTPPNVLELLESSLVPGGGVSVALSETIEDLMERAGYSSGQYETGLIAAEDQQVRALALSQVSGTRAPLELLQGAYFFEAAKTDKVDFFPRQSTSIVTIPYADLGFSFDGGDQEQLVLTNSNDLELPAQIAVQYANMLADYQAGTEFSDRLLTEQESTNVVQLALGLVPVEAKAIADKMLSDLIAGQWRFTIKMPLKYAYLMPGDIFNVVARDGRDFRGRIQSKKDSQVLIEFECVLDSVGTLDVDAATDANYVGQNTIIDPSVTEWEAMDIPLLRDADNNVSWYGAITPVLVDDTQWPGGVLVQSFSPPAYTQLYTTGDLSAIGECDTTLGNWTYGAMFDETNTLTVTLYAGELESVARADMLLDQELNAAAVGVDGQWELIRFRNAELTGQTSTGLNIYRLSGLLRGQRGTEWAIGLHGADERFVLLDTTIRNISSQLNELNLERFIKGVTSNTPLNDVTERSFTHTGVSLKPFSVAQLRALPDGSDIEVTWNRRTRLSYRYAGINPVVPLGEATEAYRVWIYDGSTLVRTENVTTDSYTYSAADIASDGFVSTDTIRIEVAQVSAIVGAGYIEEVEVIAP
jgi:hypothetical protein